MTSTVFSNVEHYAEMLAGQSPVHSVVEEMEARAEAQAFPIVGRAVAVFLELQARSIGARRIFEMGSGFGYSAHWFARAVGPGGEVICSDPDPDLARDAVGYLEAAGLADRVRYHAEPALSALERENGEFDIVFCDVAKDEYPASWRAARQRIRVGGLYICDNVLWRGTVLAGGDVEGFPGWTKPVRDHNLLVAGDPDFVSALNPVRDGVLVALRLR